MIWVVYLYCHRSLLMLLMLLHALFVKPLSALLVLHHCYDLLLWLWLLLLLRLS